jgi:ATP-dependent protease ClpP protease subunit
MDFFVLFEGAIDQQSSLRLVQAIQKGLATEGVKKIIVFFSSLGGSIYDGFIIATLIQNSRIPILVHATNHIDSIGNVIYLSAKERTAESHAKFYLHGAAVQGNFDEKALKEKLSELKTQNSRIAYFISENSNIPLQKVQSMMRVGTTISAQDALKFNITHQIAHKNIPQNVPREEIVYIN